VTDSLRTTALNLHALSKADREWILNQLSIPDQAEIKLMLKELASLGVPRESSSMVAAAMPEPAKPNVEELSDLKRLDTAHAGAIIRVLSPQPNWLIAAVLSLHSWKWRDEVLTQLCSERYDRIKMLLPHRVVLKSKVKEALMHGLVQELGVPLHHYAGNDSRSSGGWLGMPDNNRIMNSVLSKVRTWLA
jgi:hypothetical protein